MITQNSTHKRSFRDDDDVHTTSAPQSYHMQRTAERPRTFEIPLVYDSDSHIHLFLEYKNFSQSKESHRALRFSPAKNFSVK